MTDFPVDHLSASSINKFLRCPRQWQEKYVYKQVEPSNSSLIVGSVVHRELEKWFQGDHSFSFETTWQSVLDENAGVDITWKDSPETSRRVANDLVMTYWDRVGRYLKPVGTEIEIALEIPGIPIPVVGFIDLETEDKAIDFKTTGYFNRKVSLNPEWKLQANIYQLHHEKPAEFHVLTRSKTDPVVIPTTSQSELYVPVPQRRNTEAFLRQIWDVMEFYWQRFGEDEYPGNVIHPWASKYCSVEHCCQRS